MPSPITPRALKPGDTIAFISPSARLNDTLSDVMQRATTVLTNRGYKVRTFFTKDTTIQSSINNRLSEIRSAFTDPAISAIICTIGGTTFTELLPSLIADTELHSHIRSNPKIVIGYSDITGVHWLLHALTGLRTFYGPGAIPELGLPGSADNPASALAFCVENMFRVIERPAKPLGEIPRSLKYDVGGHEFFEKPSSTKMPDLAPSPKWIWLRPGKATGRLFGGCLTVAARLSGVRAIVPDWRGKIVFMETATGDDEKGNPISRVRAAFADLIAQGVFDEAVGLVVGRAFGYDTDKKRQQFADVITGLFCEGALAEKNHFPILFNVDFGHTTPMVTLPYDVLAEMDSERDRFAVVEAAVV